MSTVAGGLAEYLAFFDHILSALGHFEEKSGFHAQLPLPENFYRGWPTGVRHIADAKVTEIVGLMINEAHPRICAWFMGAPGMPFPLIFTPNDTWRETLCVWATQRDSDLATEGSIDMLIHSGMFGVLQQVAGASSVGSPAAQALLPVAPTPAHQGPSSKKKHIKHVANPAATTAAAASAGAGGSGGAAAVATSALSGTAPVAAAVTRLPGSLAPLAIGALNHNVKVTTGTVTIKFDARHASVLACIG